jgi:hypothetical protein
VGSNPTAASKRDATDRNAHGPEKGTTPFSGPIITSRAAVKIAAHLSLMQGGCYTPTF